MTIPTIETRDIKLPKNGVNGLTTHPNYMNEGRLFDYLNNQLNPGEELGARIITDYMIDIELKLKRGEDALSDEKGVVVRVPFEQRITMLAAQTWDKYMDILPEFKDREGEVYDDFVALRTKATQLHLGL